MKHIYFLYATFVALILVSVPVTLPTSTAHNAVPSVAIASAYYYDDYPDDAYLWSDYPEVYYVEDTHPCDPLWEQDIDCVTYTTPSTNQYAQVTNQNYYTTPTYNYSYVAPVQTVTRTNFVPVYYPTPVIIPAPAPTQKTYTTSLTVSPKVTKSTAKKSSFVVTNQKVYR